MTRRLQHAMPGLLAILFMLGGFAGLRRIRHRRRGTAGLGFAVFTAWIVPVLAILGIAVAVLEASSATATRCC